jgi:hypothetical protein
MYYKDLTQYEYSTPHKVPNVLNIGWLDKDHDFEKGATPEGLLAKLRQIILSEGNFQSRVNQMRGVHSCHLCLANNFSDVYVGSCQLWIPSIENNIYFAAPSTIIHYIQDHNYKPPNIFVESVLKLSMDEDFNGEQLFYEIAKKSISG